MSVTLNVILGITLIFLGTTLGSSLIFFFKNKGEISPKINQITLGFASGIMLSASIFSLIVPAYNYNTGYMPSYLVVSLGIIIGVLFIYAIDKLVPHLHVKNNEEEGIKTDKFSKTSKMFLAVTIHNIPEGLTVGISYGIALANLASGMSVAESSIMSALFLAIGMMIQNIPEGFGVALPMLGETSKKKSFIFGSLSGAVEPVAAVIGLVLAYQIEALMPWSLAFAAGCMMYVIVEEMIPDFSKESSHHYGLFSFFIGFILMMILDSALG